MIVQEAMESMGKCKPRRRNELLMSGWRLQPVRSSRPSIARLRLKNLSAAPRNSSGLASPTIKANTDDSYLRVLLAEDQILNIAQRPTQRSTEKRKEREKERGGVRERN